jgi:hypothetical protein
MDKQINLSDLTLVELKAYAYDEIVKLNISNSNLRIINDELSKRQQKGDVEATPVTTKQ